MAGHLRYQHQTLFDRAVELAFDTEGVAAVESRLTVKMSRPMPENEE